MSASAESAPKRPRPPAQKLSAEDRDFVFGVLEKKREQLRLSKNSFAKTVLKCSAGTYSQILADNYPGNTAAKVRSFRETFETVKNVDTVSKVAIRTDAAGDFFETDVMRAVKNGLLDASLRNDELRLVVFLAKTGFGKDTIIRHVAATIGDFNRGDRLFEFRCVEASDPWRKSYFSACCDIVAAIDGTDVGTLSARVADNVLIAKLRQRRYIIAINEANYFGPQAFNLLKRIINQTPTVLLVCAIPEIFDRMKLKSWAEAEQVARRAYVVVEAPKITSADVVPFLRGLRLENPEASAAAVAVSANQFGGFGLVKRAVENLAGKEGEVTVDDLETAVAKAQAYFAQIKRSPK